MWYHSCHMMPLIVNSTNGEAEVLRPPRYNEVSLLDIKDTKKGSKNKVNFQSGICVIPH